MTNINQGGKEKKCCEKCYQVISVEQSSSGTKEVIKSKQIQCSHPFCECHWKPVPTVEEKRCKQDDLSYTSIPPQNKCKNCGQFWIQGENPPICKPLCRIKPPHGPCKVCSPEKSPVDRAYGMIKENERLSNYPMRAYSFDDSPSQEQKKEECTCGQFSIYESGHRFGGKPCLADEYSKEEKNLIKNILSPSPQNWEAVFDRGFCFEEDGGKICMFQIWEDGTRSLVRPEYIKGFIKVLLSRSLASQKEELKERIQKLVKTESKYTLKFNMEQVDRNENYNQALSDVLLIINNVEE